MSATTTDPVINAESQSGTIIAAAVVFVTVSGVLVLLRLYTRGFILRNLGPEDWTIAASLVSLSQQARPWNWNCRLTALLQALAVATTIGTVIRKSHSFTGL